MSFDTMLQREGGPVVLVTPATTTDRNNNEVLDWDESTRATVTGWVQQRDSTSNNAGRTSVTTEYVAFLEPGAAPTKDQRVEFAGETYECEVDSKPRLLTRHGAPHHWEFRVKQVTG